MSYSSFGFEAQFLEEAYGWVVVGYYLEVDFVDVLLLGLVEEVYEHCCS